MQFWLGPLLGAAGAAILYKYVFRHPEAAAAEAAAAKAASEVAVHAPELEGTHVTMSSPERPAQAVLSPAARRSTTSAGTGGSSFQGVSVEAAPAPLLPVAENSELR